MSISQADFDAMQTRTVAAMQRAANARKKPSPDAATAPPCLECSTISQAACSEHGTRPRASGEQINERELQKQLCQLLRLKGVTFLCPTFGKKTRMKVGWPDLTFCWQGKPCVWEIKVGANKLTEEQSALLAQLANEGWRVAEIRSMVQAFEFLQSGK